MTDNPANGAAERHDDPRLPAGFGPTARDKLTDLIARIAGTDSANWHDDVQSAIDAFAAEKHDAGQEEEHQRFLDQPSLRTCIVPTCLRQFDVNARMTGRTPARPTWSGDGWRHLRGSAVHTGGGYICPDHVDLIVAHMARRIEPYTPGRIDVRCTCGQWSTSGLGITWHGAARGLWEQHLLREMGTIK